MQLKNKKSPWPPQGRSKLSPADLENLKITVAQYNKASLLKALDNTISIYRSLRRKLYTDKIQLQEKAEKKCHGQKTNAKAYSFDCKIFFPEQITDHRRRKNCRQLLKRIILLEGFDVAERHDEGRVGNHG